VKSHTSPLGHPTAIEYGADERLPPGPWAVLVHVVVPNIAFEAVPLLSTVGPVE
jgi:hypothetical protein